jgi:hypothetical protein
MDSGQWARKQLKAATDIGAQLVLQPVTNLNCWTHGVEAHVGMRVRTNPAFCEAYKKFESAKNYNGALSFTRWGVQPDHVVGTIIGTCDDRSELVVKWDSGFTGSCIPAGKRHEYWLITA